MARPPKKESEKLVNASTKLKPHTSQIIEGIARSEGTDVSKVTRRLIEEGLESRSQALKRGGALGVQLLERVRLLSLDRQYDLIALADALLERQHFQNSINLDLTTLPDATKHDTQALQVAAERSTPGAPDDSPPSDQVPPRYPSPRKEFGKLQRLVPVGSLMPTDNAGGGERK